MLKSQAWRSESPEAMVLFPRGIDPEYFWADALSGVVVADTVVVRKLPFGRPGKFAAATGSKFSSWQLPFLL